MFEDNRSARRFNVKAKAMARKARRNGGELNGKDKAEFDRNAGRFAKASANMDASDGEDSGGNWSDWD